MFISEEILSEIMDEYDPINTASDCFYFVAAVMELEVAEMKEKCSYATNTISRMESAIHEIYDAARDIDNEIFSEG